MSIHIINDTFPDYQLNKSRLKKILHTIIDHEKKEFDLVSIILENDEYLRMLKKQYFNQNIYTDVISFNLEENNNPIDGEIYISIPRVIDNANKYNTNFNNEFKRILIHGLLHLIGYNDILKRDKQHMTTLENKYINLNQGEIISR
tara:strand:+ start:117 stop:554 length:438 start_codon:yes stop_codon:yes gene_type:complete